MSSTTWSYTDDRDCPNCWERINAPQSFWDTDEIDECPHCGASLECDLDGDTEWGFYWHVAVVDE